MKKITAFLMIFSLLLLSSCKKEDEKSTLYISTWGLGMDKLVEDIYKPFEEENNCKIVVDTGSNPERYEKIKSNPNYKVDLVEFSDLYSSKAMQNNLFEKIDIDKIIDANNLIDPAKNKLKNEGVLPFTTNGIMVLYNKDLVKKEDIKSWEDLWKTDFKNQIAIPALSSTFGPAIMYMASDVAKVDIKENEDKVFEKLVELKENVVTTYQRTSELIGLLQNDEISIAIIGDFSYPIIKDSLSNVEVLYPDNQTYLNFNTIAISKNSQNKDLAYKFLNYKASKKINEIAFNDFNDAPVNKLANIKENVNTTYGKIVDNAKIIDFNFVNDRLNDWIDKFNNLFNQ